ncbi:slightly ste11-like protein [Mycoemilia scoparia]|uniref:Slightly ste11-like protein n=1 Tax=Mycoemilia scoparia TaxID=417184 RepID=A0A9W8DP04_9FUNG|nr:slightly ste11-like protein [Mycoemilia scoparia]
MDYKTTTSSASSVQTVLSAFNSQDFWDLDSTHLIRIPPNHQVAYIPKDDVKYLTPDLNHDDLLVNTQKSKILECYIENAALKAKTEPSIDKMPLPIPSSYNKLVCYNSSVPHNLSFQSCASKIPTSVQSIINGTNAKYSNLGHGQRIVEAASHRSISLPASISATALSTALGALDSQHHCAQAGDAGFGDWTINDDELNTLNQALLKTPRSKSRARKTPTKRLGKPMNAFILYRRSLHSIVQKSNPGIQNADISRIIAKMWKSEPKEKVDEWKRLAAEERIKHDIKHQEMYGCLPRASNTSKLSSTHSKQPQRSHSHKRQKTSIATSAPGVNTINTAFSTPSASARVNDKMTFSGNEDLSQILYSLKYTPSEISEFVPDFEYTISSSSSPLFSKMQSESVNPSGPLLSMFGTMDQPPTLEDFSINWDQMLFNSQTIQESALSQPEVTSQQQELTLPQLSEMGDPFTQGATIDDNPFEQLDPLVDEPHHHQQQQCEPLKTKKQPETEENNDLVATVCPNTD